MKKLIANLAMAFGCTAHYSGSNRIMFLSGERSIEAVKALAKERPPFKLLSNEQTQAFVERFNTMQTKEEAAALAEDVMNSRVSFEFGDTDVKEVTKVMEEVAQENKAKKDDSAKKAALEALQRPQVPDLAPTRTDEIAYRKPADLVKEQPSEEVDVDARRKAIDEYLLANPIDRNVKGCYVPAAEKFGVKSEYIRDRYRKLRDKGLVA